MVHVDTGDVFQGAPIFNEFRGEVEFRIYSMLGVDSFSVGNHEFDMGITNLVTQAHDWATFPMLNINYSPENPYYPGSSQLATIVHPYIIVNVNGFKVGIIGIGSLGSIVSMYEGANSLGITPVDTVEMTQFYVDFLRPVVDTVIIASHLGLRAEKTMERASEDQLDLEDNSGNANGDGEINDDMCLTNQRLPGDEQLIAHTEGIDVVFGGHLHIVLSPPEVIQDCDPDIHCTEIVNFLEKRGCLKAQRDTQGNIVSIEHVYSRKVPLMHSGAFVKFVGELDTVFSKPEIPDDADPAVKALMAANRWEVKAYRQIIHPVDNRIPPEEFDGEVQWVLDKYTPELYTRLPLTRYIAYSPKKIRRFASGYGDSALGNIVATAMQTRRRVETDFSLTNTLGIRSDIESGPVSIETMYNVFPFENSITTLTLSGVEVKKLLDYVALRSSRRGCQAQAQVSGVTFVMNCNDHMVAPFKDPDSFESAHRITIGGSRLTQPDKYGVDENGKALCKYDGVRCESGNDCPDSVEPAKPCPEGTSFGEGQCCPEGELCTPLGCGMPISPYVSYTLAANDYIARGGSGFRVLEHNTTQYNTGIPLRDAVIDYMYTHFPGCGGYLSSDELSTLKSIIDSLKAKASSEARDVFANSYQTDLVDALRDQLSQHPSYARYVGCAEDMADVLVKDCAYLEGASLEEMRRNCENSMRLRAAQICIKIPCIEANEEGRIERIFPASEQN